jgi:hypothetical protein
MSYEFTKLSEVEVTSELKEDDVILVVQDGTVKRYTGKVGGASVCCIEITQDDVSYIDGFDFSVLSHTFYDVVSNAVNNNENIIISMNVEGISMKVNIITIDTMSDEFASESLGGLPGGYVL